MMISNPEHRSREHIDIDDARLAHSIVSGTFIGIPLVFVVSTLLALRVGLVNAMAIALLPTIFSGSFVGGLILLMRAMGRAERHAALVPVAARIPSPVTGRVAPATSPGR